MIDADDIGLRPTSAGRSAGLRLARRDLRGPATVVIRKLDGGLE